MYLSTEIEILTRSLPGGLKVKFLKNISSKLFHGKLESVD